MNGNRSSVSIDAIEYDMFNFVTFFVNVPVGGQNVSQLRTGPFRGTDGAQLPKESFRRLDVVHVFTTVPCTLKGAGDCMFWEIFAEIVHTQTNDRIIDRPGNFNVQLKFAFINIRNSKVIPNVK